MLYHKLSDLQQYIYLLCSQVCKLDRAGLFRLQVRCRSFIFLQPAIVQNMFLWKMPRNAGEKTDHASPLQASVSFTATKVSHVPKPTHSRRALQSYVALGVDVLLLMSEELDPKFLSSSGFQDIQLMVFCLPYGTFLLSFFGGSFSPQTFNIGFQGSFLCTRLRLLVFPCSLHCRLMAVNTETPTCPSPASSEHQVHIPSWMPAKHLQLSTSFFE